MRVDTTCRIANSGQTETVAEGYETNAQLEVLTAKPRCSTQDLLPSWSRALRVPLRGPCDRVPVKPA